MNRNGKLVTVLAILALLSAGSIALSAANYIQGASAAGNVQLKLSSLRLLDEENAEVLIAFYLKNGSSLSVRLDEFHFSLYLNKHFMGTNTATLTKRTIGGFEETTMDFVIPIRPFFLQYIEQARKEEVFLWSVDGSAKVLLPFKEREIWLNVTEHWSGY